LNSRAPASLTLLTRPECGLCEEMLADLRSLSLRVSLPQLAVIDVDSDAELQRRYGLKIPVLLLDSVPICSHRLDAAELQRLLRRP
jgi:hypothetical protein